MTGKEKQILKGHRDWVNLVAFSADGRYLASESQDSMIRVWDATTGIEQHTLHVGTSFKTLPFDNTASYLYTDGGLIELDIETRPDAQLVIDERVIKNQSQHASNAKDSQMAGQHGTA
ncbi:hypothetical protein TrVGV298_006142 [Trichoderma virens]|nr:hypothetical protein TrVGV298_006142 [Trichoderma virens]